MIVLCYEHGVLIYGMDGCIGVIWRFGVCFEKTSSWIGIYLARYLNSLRTYGKWDGKQWDHKRTRCVGIHMLKTDRCLHQG